MNPDGLIAGIGQPCWSRVYLFIGAAKASLLAKSSEAFFISSQASVRTAERDGPIGVSPARQLRNVDRPSHPVGIPLAGHPVLAPAGIALSKMNYTVLGQNNGNRLYGQV